MNFSLAIVLAAFFPAMTNAGLIQGPLGDSAIIANAVSTTASASLGAPAADSTIPGIAGPRTGWGTALIASTLPVTGHATSILAIQGGITTTHAKPAGGGAPGAGHAGSGSGGGGPGAAGAASGMALLGVSGVLLSASHEASTNNMALTSAAASSLLPASSNVALSFVSPLATSSGDDALPANTASLSSSASIPLSDFLNSNTDVRFSAGSTVPDSFSNLPVSQAFVIHNPEPGSIMIFAGLCGPLAIGWLRRRSVAFQSPVP